MLDGKVDREEVNVFENTGTLDGKVPGRLAEQKNASHDGTDGDPVKS